MAKEAYLDENFVSFLKERINIVDVIGRYLELKKRGENYWAACPFHNEKTPSFSVNEARQIYKCFGCGEGGDVISFLMKKENLTFVEAAKKLCDIAGIHFPDREQSLSEEDLAKRSFIKRLYELHLDAAKYFKAALFKNIDGSMDYIVQKRKLPEKTIKKFGLGYVSSGEKLKEYLKSKSYTDEELIGSGIFKEKDGRVYSRFFRRLMFPIFDKRGAVIAFGGRVMDSGQPKYLNSPETDIFSKKNNLYALNFAYKYRPKYLILVEGYMDVIALYKSGIAGAVASLGTSLTKEQAGVLRKTGLPLYLCYDSDTAGTKATLRALDILDAEKVTTYVLDLGEFKDPDELIKAKGAGKFNELMMDGTSPAAFRLDIMKKDHDLSSFLGKNEYIKKACAYLKTLQDPVETEVQIKRLSNDMDISVKAIGQMIYGRYFSPKQFEKQLEGENKREKLIVKKPKLNEYEENLLQLLHEYPGLKTAVKKQLDISMISPENAPKFIQTLDSDTEPQNEPEDSRLMQRAEDMIKKIKLEYLNQKIEENNKLLEKESALTDEEKLEIAKRLLKLNKEAQIVRKLKGMYYGS